MAERHYISVDISNLQDKIDLLKTKLTKENADRALHDTCVDVAKNVKTIMARAVVQEYAVTQGWVRSGIGQWQSAGVGCVIPLKGTRGVIGGTFKKRGKAGRPKKGRKYKISTTILKGKWTPLPAKMDHQGGNPPFVANGIVMTRTKKGQSHPIARVAGLGVPQMPLNQAKDEVIRKIHDKMSQRLDHHFQRFFGT